MSSKILRGQKRIGIAFRNPYGGGVLYFVKANDFEDFLKKGGIEDSDRESFLNFLSGNQDLVEDASEEFFEFDFVI